MNERLVTNELILVGSYFTKTRKIWYLRWIQYAFEPSSSDGKHVSPLLEFSELIRKSFIELYFASSLGHFGIEIANPSEFWTAVVLMANDDEEWIKEMSDGGKWQVEKRTLSQ